MNEVMTVLYGVLLAGAVYGGIRADLKILRRDVDEVREYLWGVKHD